ncbi:MAG: Wzz/FepE/Etk N-terminal domain-containing protein [Bacteroidales bacterium]|jgi:uncharacterized protein involved in exopolysaccharide biosynthesis
MNQQGTVLFRADSVNLLNIVIKYRKVLLLTAIAAVIVSAAASFMIKPLFRATVVLYPATSVSETQSIFGVQGTATPLFGDETATEKVLQILKSDIIKNFIVAKYDLMNHYGISKGARYKYTMLDMRMKRYIGSRKTQYNSVEINVLDPDPILAARIANDISHQIDTVFNQIVRDAGKKDLQAISISYMEQLKRVRSLEDSLHSVLPAGSAAAIPVNIKAGSAKSSWALAATQYSVEFLRLINMFEAENESLSAIRNRLTEARMASEQNMPYTHIINEAKVPEKKAFPQRAIIVLASLLSSLLILIFILTAGEMIVNDEK